VLEIIDEGVPRKFFSPGAARVQFKRGSPHTPENVVDIDKNVASANTNAFKRAINRLTNFGDDIYRKQVEDLELTDGNIEVLNNLIGRLDDIDITDKIMNAINNGEIHRSNIDKTVQYLRKQIENKEKEDG
jgi:muramoyltetrapeptide carboxypeptidase LdcA involved in peptidoglycan recycling